MAHSVRKHLRLEIAAFDSMIRRFIPGYDRMLEEAAGRVAAVLPELVIDLGAGTGALSEAFLERGGVGHVQLLDVDPEMLDQARGRLSRFGERASFVEGSYDDPLPDCDAIAASLALHHIPTLEAKRELFRRAFAALRPGGVFVNGDANMPEDEDRREATYRVWVDHMHHNGISEEQAWRHFEEWSEEDTYLSLEAELEALKEVGFDASLVWHLGPIGVVVARRPLI